MMMLCNSNLFNVATDASIDLPKYIRSKSFNRRWWYPEGLVLVRGKGALHAGSKPVTHGLQKHALGKKTVADVSEAIIGAALLSTKDLPNKFDLAIRAVTRLVKSEEHAIDSWSEFASIFQPPVWQLEEHDPVANDLSRKIQEKMGYTFRYPRLLRSAFTHSSDQRSLFPDYQRLEFLGDAILDMACINWLFNKFEDKNPQWLTEHKMAMVSNKFLAAVAVKLDFDKHIKTTTPRHFQEISRYAREVRTVLEVDNHNIRRDFWTEIASPPKALSDLVESYLGAVFVDSGFDYGEAESFFAKHILWFFEDMKLYDTFANKHPTTFLHKQLTNFGCLDYKLLSSDPPQGPIEPPITAAVLIHGKVVASAESSSQRYAKVRASQNCLHLLDSLTVAEFRTKFGCTCRETRDHEQQDLHAMDTTNGGEIEALIL